MPPEARGGSKKAPQTKSEAYGSHPPRIVRDWGACRNSPVKVPLSDLTCSSVYENVPPRERLARHSSIGRVTGNRLMKSMQGTRYRSTCFETGAALHRALALNSERRSARRAHYDKVVASAGHVVHNGAGVERFRLFDRRIDRLNVIGFDFDRLNDQRSGAEFGEHAALARGQGDAAWSEAFTNERTDQLQ